MHDDLTEYVSDRNQFTWRKETFFGGLYQKVVGTKNACAGKGFIGTHQNH